MIKSDGSIAWTINLVEEHIKEGPEIYQVHVADGTGEHTLASSTTLNPYSLALAGSIIYWTQNGKPESATLH